MAKNICYSFGLHIKHFSRFAIHLSNNSTNFIVNLGQNCGEYTNELLEIPFRVTYTTPTPTPTTPNIWINAKTRDEEKHVVLFSSVLIIFVGSVCRKNGHRNYISYSCASVLRFTPTYDKTTFLKLYVIIFIPSLSMTRIRIIWLKR